MLPAERNKRFAEDAQASLNPDQQVIVYCSRGGTLTTGVVGRRGKYDDPDRSFGIESRSLKGCYELMQVWQTAAVRGWRDPSGNASVCQPPGVCIAVFAVHVA